MRKRIHLFVVTILASIVLTGCGGSPVKSDALDGVKQAESTKEKVEVVLDTKEYQLLKGTKDSEGFTKYVIRILDDDRRVIWERSYKLTRDTIGLGMLDNDIVFWRIGIGTGLNYTQYYDRKDRRESPAYTTPLLVGYGKVVAPKRGKLIVADMFDHKLFYKELPIEDFPPVANPVDGYAEIKWAGADKLSVTHLVGQKGEKYSTRTVVFDLNE